MKVERKKVKPKFEPIVITIESEVEAEVMWNRLNLGEGNFESLRLNEKENKHLSNHSMSMWQSYNSIYNKGNKV